MLLRRLYSAGVAFVGAALVGAVGYFQIGDGQWSFADCLYMSVITLSTVGFAETLTGMHGVPGARVWTVVLILLGSGTLLYFASTLTAFIVEGDLRGAIRRRTMNRHLERANDHVIVCGVGATGLHVASELSITDTQFVVIDTNLERIERLAEGLGTNELLYVHGDATEDHVLERAGIRRASGLIAALHEDRDNLFVIVTARALSDAIRLVAKAVESDNIIKLERAGANAVVAPAQIGGVRLASEVVRPSVLQFLDGMLRDPRQQRGIEEVLICADSPAVGVSLADAGIRDASDALVVAIRSVDGEHEYNPSPRRVIRAGMVLIVLVEASELEALRMHISGG